MSSATPTDVPLMLLRPAEPADAPEIAELFITARAAAVPLMPPGVHTDDATRAFFTGRVAAPETETWVAEDGDRVVGFVLLTPTWLDHLYVHPEAQRAGVGTALVQLAQSLRPDGLGLWVFETNTPARALYERHGFVEVERTDGSGNEEKAPDIRLEWSPAAGSGG